MNKENIISDSDSLSNAINDIEKVYALLETAETNIKDAQNSLDDDLWFPDYVDFPGKSVKAKLNIQARVLNSNQIIEKCNSAIDTMNGIENSILNTIKINRDINWDNIMNVIIDGKKEYVVPGKYFRELLISYYM